MKTYTEAQAKKLLKQHVYETFADHVYEKTNKAEFDKEDPKKPTQLRAADFFGVTRAHMSNCMNVNVESYPPNEKMLNAIGLTKESIIVKIRL